MGAEAAAPAPPITRARRGLTLLEVVIALLLFALMSTMLLSGQSAAADAVERTEIARDMAELMSLRLGLILLQPNEYDDGAGGRFPYSGASSRLVNEEDVFGDRFPGYEWEVSITETVGAGANSAVTIEGGDERNLLFPDEAASTEDDDTETDVEAGDVDRMLLIEVTVYPPGYEESAEILPSRRARKIWTATYVPESEDE